MAEYQGHRSKAAWNVALYLANEEPLYRLAMATLARHGVNTNHAALALMRQLPEKTPDGFPYTLKSICEALDGMRD